MNSLRNDVYEYVREQYDTQPEYLWRRFPGYAVLRHTDNRKWYGIIMNLRRKSLGLAGEDMVDVLNLKVDDPLFYDLLIHQSGIFPGYHLSKGHWISVLLDGSVPMEEICPLISGSYQATASKKKRTVRPPKEWLIPANPKYYDVEQAFRESEEIDWKQGSGIQLGDTVYMYVAAPVSAILYRCEVTGVDIPCEYRDEHLTIRALMRLRLTKRYEPERFPFELLKQEYGIAAVRGPRGIPNRLSEALRE